MTPLNAFGPRSWARPESLSFGRLPMSTYLSRGNEVSLDGDWAFTLVPKPEGVNDDHLVGEIDVWKSAAVPGCWTMQGFDKPQYTNVQMPFPGPPPSVPRHNPTGVYRRTVAIPSDWDGQRVILHVGAAETVLYVYVDGEPVGMGKDSRLPQEFDITSFITAGDECDLALVVVRWSDATYLEDQDHWHHAGLHRSAFLYAVPGLRIGDVHTSADVDGTLRAKVRLEGKVGSTRGWRLRLECGDESAEASARFEHESWIVNSYAFEGRGASLSLTVPNVRPWSATTPELYEATLTLINPDGDVADSVSLNVGFRRVEIVGAELLINGRAQLIRGVNRHDSDARLGKTVTRESIERDVALMKQFNFNAIRTAHYPNDPYLLEVCDRLGMYVIDEANIESHAYLRSLTKNPMWHGAILDRVSRMAQRDKNHPCVIMWSLGNESGVSAAHRAAADWLRTFDPTRPVHYESGLSEDMMAEGGQSYSVAILSKPRAESDVIAPMYPPVAALEAWATETTPDRPLIMCEYIHAMGNSCGDADEYWRAIRQHHGLQGGFVWDWADQALVQGDRLAYGGDFGDVPNDGAFCMNGLVDTFRVPHPSLFELAHVMHPTQITVEGDGFRVTNDDTGDSSWVAAEPGDIATLEVDGTFGQLVRQLPTEAPAGSESLRIVEPELSLWRAPIDNETFGGGHAARWEAIGLRTPDASWNWHCDGEMTHVEVDVPERFDDCARVGVRLELGSGIHSVEWFGKGPHENYSDRCASARYGTWRTLVDDWAVPYVHPQSSGNRTGVCWARFLDADGSVVFVLDQMDGLNLNVARYTDEQIDAVQHLEELPPSNSCYVWISVRERGVGSGACGPDVSDAHRIRPGMYSWSYRAR